VMSVATLVGPRPAIDAEGALAPLVARPSFLVTPPGLAALANALPECWPELRGVERNEILIEAF